MRFDDYGINIASLPAENGGGWLVTLPDLPGCIAEGETIDEAVAEARDAFDAWAMAEDVRNDGRSTWRPGELRCVRVKDSAAGRRW